MIVLSFFDYSFFLQFYWVIYGLNIAFLLMVIPFGKVVNNAKRWLELGGIRFQPSELTKIMLILFYSQYIMKHWEKLNSLKNIAVMILLLLPPLYLIYDQPDMSTSIVIDNVLCCMVCRRTELQTYIWCTCNGSSRGNYIFCHGFTARSDHYQ